MEIKSYPKSGYVCWSNSKAHSQLLCCAPFAPNEEGLYPIQILSIDIAQRSKELEVIGSCYYPRSYRCVAWDTFGQKEQSNTMPYGMIFGGLEDGSFNLWNPAEMVRNNQNVTSVNFEEQPSLLYEEDPQENGFPIMCAQWNSLKPNFLAFGSTDVLILDVGKNISSPQLSKPGRKNPHEGSYITSVVWNKQVPHILASASQNGLIALWDIKSEKSIFQFKDSPTSINTSGRNVVICWSKNISTQIAVTLDDEKKNQLQIWDLRNQKGPIVVIDKGHSKGINSMNWCETDPQLILTCGRDSKVFCWNYTQEEEPVAQMQLTSQINEVKWSKRLPSIFAVSTDQNVSVCTLNDTNLYSYVPKWYKVSNGTTLNRCDTLLAYSENRGNTLHQYKLNFASDPAISKSIKSLQGLLKGQQKLQSQDQEFWRLISAKKSKDYDNEIYDFLNLSKSKIIKEVEKYTGKKRENVSNVNPKAQDNHPKVKAKAYIPVSGVEAASFFQTIKNNSIKPTEEEEEQENIKYDMVPRNFNWDIGKQRIIKQNILIGNYGGAIDASLKCGRTAQALIIAYSVSPQTFNTTLKTFFTQTTDSFITDTLKHLANKDTEELVRKYDIQKWRQCIALLFSISSEKRSSLLKVLANRIEQELQNQDAVLICLILAEDFTEISKKFAHRLSLKQNHSKQRKLLALNLTEKLIAIYQALTTLVEQDANFKKVIRETIYICIEQGQLVLANDLHKKYLSFSKDSLADFLAFQKGGNSQQHFKPIQLPIMKKPQKKVQQQPSKIPSNQKVVPKQIFQKKQEPQQKNTQKNQGSSANSGFSPYDNNNSQNIKKTTNLPPPPKKNPPTKDTQQQPQEIQQNKALNVNPQSQITNIKQPISPPPPPPPPKKVVKNVVPLANQTKKQQIFEQAVKHQPILQTSPPPPIIKRPPPPNLQQQLPPQQNEISKTVIKPPVQIKESPKVVKLQTPNNSFVEENREQQKKIKKNPPPPPIKRNPPPPPPKK